jgi:hypothetical protein
MPSDPSATPAAPHPRSARILLAAGIATVAPIVRRHDVLGRAGLAAIMPFPRVIPARMVEGMA